MKSNWATRGRKPDRNIEAALTAGGLRYLKAVLDGESRPWTHAVSHAVGAGFAMNEHRIVDRKRANVRNARIAEKTAEIVNCLIDLAELAEGQPVSEANVASTTYQRITSDWRRILASFGRNPSLVKLELEDWHALRPNEQTTLCQLCRTNHVCLRVAGRDLIPENLLLAG